MFAPKSTIALLSATLFASIAIASPTQEPQTPEGPKMVAESIHKARVHGISNLAKQPLAQAPGSEQAQAAAKAIHLQKHHGNFGETADQRMLREASRL